jgi:hypothetical protein
MLETFIGGFFFSILSPERRRALDRLMAPKVAVTHVSMKSSPFLSPNACASWKGDRNF